jgi:SPP1 family phage portal protein
LISLNKTGYGFAKPITFTSEIQNGANRLNSYYLDNEFNLVDLDIALKSSICGHWYEQVYIKKDTNIVKVASIDGFSTYMVCDDTVEETPILAFTISHTNNLFSLNQTPHTKYTIYDSKNITIIENQTISTVAHKLNGLPIIMTKNSQECQGDFEMVLGIVDSLNTLINTGVEDKVNMLQSLLIFFGCDVSEVNKASLSETGILDGLPSRTATSSEPAADVQWISKSAMLEADVKLLRDELRNAVYEISMIPATNSQISTASSALAVRQGFTPLEMKLSMTERYYRTTLKTRMSLILNYLEKTNVLFKEPFDIINSDNEIEYRGLLSSKPLTFNFTRNLPTDFVSTVQGMVQLKQGGLISTETAISQLAYTSNPQLELDKIQAEDIENMYSFEDDDNYVGLGNSRQLVYRNLHKDIDDINGKVTNPNAVTGGGI